MGKPTFRWNRIYISGNDRIFPPQNQHLAWKGRDGVVANDSSHRPDLKKILDSTIIDIDKVGERFGRKMDTYDEYATVQRRIARTLASMIRDVSPDRVDSILEIGSGTGLLTRMYGPVLKPEKVDFIDLCAVPKYGIASVERYFRGDAERLITDPKLGDYDIITSASAIQWFTNLPLFLKNCCGKLKPNGVFAVSSFLPGNLCEFDALRPSPLHYLTESELSRALSSVFESYRVHGEEERVLFKSAADALRHLSMTGVGAVGRSGIDSIRELKKYIPRTESGEYYLTYRPVYIVASGPREN